MTQNEVALLAIQSKLEEMGVKDVQISRDGETWNNVPVEDRAASIARVLGAYVDGKVTPFGRLNDA